MADYPATGSLGWALPLKDYIDEEGGEGGVTTYFEPESYGAVGDGTTDDTDAFLDCIAAALPVNGTILLGAKTYGISDELQLLGVNQAITLVGQGPESSILKALTTGARVTWGGEVPTGPGLAGQTLYGRPGLSNGWGFDGNEIATQGVCTGVMCAYGTWENVAVTKCDGDGFLVWSQNNTYIMCNSSGHSGNGWTVNYGAQSCEFLTCHAASNDGWDFQIRQDGGPGWGASAQPQLLRFSTGISEQDGSPYFTDTGIGGVHIREGLDITFERFALVSGGTEGSLVLTPSTANGFVGRITVRDCNVDKIYLDANSGGVAQSMGGTNEPLSVEGWTVITEIVNGSTGHIFDNSHGLPAALTYTAEGTGASAYPVHRFGAKTAAQELLWLTNSVGTVVARVDDDGNIYARNGQTEQVVIGNVFGFPGLSLLDTVLVRVGAGALLTNQLTMNSATAAQVPAVARGAASQTGDLFQAQDVTPTTLWSIDAAGVPKWDAAANQQTTVGAAGGASAPPATPVKWLKVKDSTGATLVIPAYTA